jgi:hypothetical protein
VVLLRIWSPTVLYVSHKAIHVLHRSNDELRQVEGVVRDWIRYMNEIKKTKEAFLKASLEVQKRGYTYKY